MLDHIRNAIINGENIIPVIGYELLPIREKGQIIPYLDYLSKTLVAKEKKIKLPPNGSGFTRFNSVAHQLLSLKNRDKIDTITTISECAKQIHDKVDTTYLDMIVSILPFHYFFDLTFTTHLAEAVQRLRTFPKTTVKQTTFPYFLKKTPEDLIKNDCSFEGVVYNLSGSAYQGPKLLYNYYCTDDDTLDFVSLFNRKFDIALNNYKEVVTNSSLLFLGCQYPDWLIRILINTLKPGSLDANNNLQARVFFDYCSDPSNSFFLTRHQFRFQKNLATLALISSLYTDLFEHRYVLSHEGKDFVFISYAREDLPLVQNLVCRLSASINVWFDRIEMFPGDLINLDVKSAIANCKLFIPIVTRESGNKGPDAYVRQEWRHYLDEFQENPKVIPLVQEGLNLGELGFDLDSTFARPRDNIFFITINDKGLTDQDVDFIKGRL
jgi:hypothetical protein